MACYLIFQCIYIFKTDDRASSSLGTKILFGFPLNRLLTLIQLQQLCSGLVMSNTSKHKINIHKVNQNETM